MELTESVSSFQVPDTPSTRAWPPKAALLRSLSRLTTDGPERARRIAAGHALFRGDALTHVVRATAAGGPA
ncbi:hypothetical protein ABZ651_10195, partial [Streptomyces sp. NPDC007070]